MIDWAMHKYQCQVFVNVVTNFKVASTAWNILCGRAGVVRETAW